jgi:hypothetical protein
MSYGQYFPDNSSTPDIEPSNDIFDDFKNDDEDENSILPNDIIEFNEINDLFDDFNDKHPTQSDNAIVKELLISPNSQSNNGQSQTETSDM